jgi:hypothetical protein
MESVKLKSFEKISQYAIASEKGQLCLLVNQQNEKLHHKLDCINLYSIFYLAFIGWSQLTLLRLSYRLGN